jgi:pertussis toxin subunit 1
MKLQFIKYVVMTGFFAWCSASYAIIPTSEVYRIDERPLEEITRTDVNGMWPNTEGGTLQMNDDLSRHFDGEPRDGESSAFVATTASLEQAVNIAEERAQRDENGEIDVNDTRTVYIYVIRPAENFYEINGSFENAIAGATPPQQDNLRAIINDYGNLDEWVAYHGFSADRIISYAEITGQMLHDDYYIMNDPSYWDSRMQSNALYNRNYDNDQSSSTPYTNVGTTRGYTAVVNNSTAAEDVARVLVADSCLGVGSSQVSPSLNKNSVSDNNDPCKNGNERDNITYEFYNKALLAIIAGDQ